METPDPNPFPKIELFPEMGYRVRQLVHFLFDHLQHEGISEHKNRGGGPALDRALFDQPQLPMHYSDVTHQEEVYPEPLPVIERPEAAQLERTIQNRWDSEGRYFEE